MLAKPGIIEEDARTLTFPAATLRELARLLLVLIVVFEVARRLLCQPMTAHLARRDVELAASSPCRLLYPCTWVSVRRQHSGKSNTPAFESQCINLLRSGSVPGTMATRARNYKCSGRSNAPVIRVVFLTEVGGQEERCWGVTR